MRLCLCLEAGVEERVAEGALTDHGLTDTQDVEAESILKRCLFFHFYTAPMDDSSLFHYKQGRIVHRSAIKMKKYRK